MTKVHIIFGSERLMKKYAEDKQLLGQYVLLATHPETLEKIVGYHKDLQFVTVRYPKDVWEPTTHPCSKRVADTETIIKQSKRLGATVTDVRPWSP